MKKSFLQDHPLMTAMLHTDTVDKAIRNVGACVADGCDAICWQVCQLQEQFHNAESYRRVLDAAGDKPVYVTYYRHHFNEKKSDDTLADGLLTLAESGATLCDVMGDLYDMMPGELTMDAAAIQKQKQLINALHASGVEVLMSSHINEFMPADRVLEIAMEHQSRGADISKIVTGAQNMEEEIENLRITALLKEKLDIPFLFLSAGESIIHRRIGPMLGRCMWLCKQEYVEPGVQVYPLLKKLKVMVDNF